MSEATDEVSPAATAPEPTPPVEPRRDPQRTRRRRRVLLATMAVLTGLGAGLALAGLSAVRNSTLGRYEPTAGPDEPGYRAAIVSSPTLGVMLVADDGTLAGAVVLALAPDDTSGTVVLVPTSIEVTDAAASGEDGADDGPGGATGEGMTLAEAYETGGVAAAAPMLGGVLNAAIDHTVEIDATTWEQLLAPVGAVEVALDEPVAEWDAGDVRLQPDEVGGFLAALEDGEDDLARMSRQQQFWEAWLAEVEDGGRSALPGEVGSGIGRFVEAIADDDGVVEALPVIRVDDGDADAAGVFRADPTRLDAFVAGAIPYPRAPEPGARIRVRLLNGSGDPALLTRAARSLVAGGAEVVVIGNPDPLEQPETLLVPAGPESEPLADWLQAVIDGGTVELVPSESTAGAAGDEIDVTVILGQDAEDIFGREQTSD
jgi:hypothetical protein